MIADRFVDLYSRNSGLRDKLVAERDIVLTYALRALLDAGVMDHLAFTIPQASRSAVCRATGVRPHVDRFGPSLHVSTAREGALSWLSSLLLSNPACDSLGAHSENQVALASVFPSGWSGGP